MSLPLTFKRTNAGVIIKTGLRNKQDEQLFNRNDSDDPKISQKDIITTTGARFNKGTTTQQNKLKDNRLIYAMENELKGYSQHRSNPVKRSEYMVDGQDSTINRPIPPNEKNNSYPRYTRIATRSAKQQSNDLDPMESGKKFGDGEKSSKTGNAYGLAEMIKPEERRVQSRDDKRRQKEGQEANDQPVKRPSIKDPKAIDTKKAIFIIHRQPEKTEHSNSTHKIESNTTTPVDKKDVNEAQDFKQNISKKIDAITFQHSERSIPKASSTITATENNKATAKLSESADKISGSETKATNSNTQLVTNDRGGQSYVYQTPYSVQSTNNYSGLTSFSGNNFSTKKDVISTKIKKGDSDDENEISNYKKSSSYSSQEPQGLVGLKNIGNTCFM